MLRAQERRDRARLVFHSSSKLVDGPLSVGKVHDEEADANADDHRDQLQEGVLPAVVASVERQGLRAVHLLDARVRVEEHHVDDREREHLHFAFGKIRRADAEDHGEERQHAEQHLAPGLAPDEAIVQRERKLRDHVCHDVADDTASNHFDGGEHRIADRGSEHKGCVEVAENRPGAE